MTGIAEAVQTSTELKKPLTALINQQCYPVGGVYKLDYDSAVVLTDDYKKEMAGGVPRGGFLLAAAGENTGTGFVLEDQEVILLRVRSTAGLPNESELVQTRLAVVRYAGASGVGFDDVTDVLTRNELQQSAFDREVLGTFYTDTDERSAPIRFGADNVVVSARYQVFLPSPKVLSWLASYPGPAGPADPGDALTVGHVRFAATRRKAHLSGTDTAEVRVDVADLVGRKTAVFGMTRTGKSNTMKTLVTAVHQYGSEHGRSIGQLIFDPQGEYANVNPHRARRRHRSKSWPSPSARELCALTSRKSTPSPPRRAAASSMPAAASTRASSPTTNWSSPTALLGFNNVVDAFHVSASATSRLASSSKLNASSHYGASAKPMS